MEPYYFHVPGHPSRWGVVDVGLKCVHSCKHCFYSFMGDNPKQFEGMRHAKWHSKEHLFAVVESLAESGFLGFDVTGGEPGAYPHIVEVIKRATDLGLSSRIITLGQFLGTRNLLDRLLEAGLTDFRFSLHATEPEMFKTMTGGDLSLLLDAMDRLAAQGFQYMTNTTITADNYKSLPSIAKFMAGRPELYSATFLMFMPYYEWNKGDRTDLVRVPYPTVAPYLRDAVAIVEEAGIACTVRYAPLCTIAGLEKNHAGVLGVRYDPFEWMNMINHQADPEKVTLEDMINMGKRIPMAAGEPSPGAALFGAKGHIKGHPICAARGASPQQLSKVFPENCQKCSAIEVCDGMDSPYLAEYGDEGHFVPYVSESRGKILDQARLKYTPAFFVKRKQFGDVKSAVKRAFKPKPIGQRPLVSVVVTCYNYGEYLTQCLASLEKQTWDNLQVVIVDDCSTDNTAEIMRRFPKFHGLTLNRNTGLPASARNYGLRWAHGDLLMCLDADDWVEPSYVEECVREFQSHPEASIVYPGTQCFGTQEDMFSAGPYDMDVLLKGCIMVCASMYRREVYEATGGYCEDPEIKGIEDWLMWTKAGGLGFFGTPLPRQLFHYRRHMDGIFESEVVPNHEEKHRQMVLRLSDLYPPNVVKQAREGKITEWSVD